MCKHLTTEPADNRCTHYLRQILFGEIPEYKENPHPLNRCGEGQGMFIVSIDRHYVRPIVRGKETKSVEFGAKAVSYTHLDVYKRQDMGCSFERN